MSEYLLITATDYESLPAEDDEESFLALEAICRRNLERLSSGQSISQIGSLRESYMAIVFNAASECGISDLTYSRTGNVNDRFAQFVTDVDGLVARLRLRGRRRSGPYSVQLTTNTRTKIEHQVSRLRRMIEESDLPESRKRALLAKLDELSQEIANSRRVSFGKILACLGPVLAAVAGLTTISADGPNAVSNIITLISKDKETEDNALQRLAPPPKALPAPLPPPEPAHLDDDIPF
jgi:hypothetical protein